MSSQQYREFAKECLQWAEESTSEQDRRHFVDMAKAWMHAAAEIQRLTSPETTDGASRETPDRD
jgi:hypothetical protein